MMTPSQIKNYEFKAAGRNAYKSDDVDSFFGEVLVNYEKIYRENGELIKRLSLLADKLEEYKAGEVDIKQAVLSAQKAADIITRDAEESAAQLKEEAESILAAAKGEADIIKVDAEKQAIADSDLLLAMARDKAEDIIKKAKEKAHGILIAANNSASDTVGAANRTITSESIHYDMLKKEVSEFRASILAQYKAHIELISKLPELAVEEAGKIEIVRPEVEISVDDLDEIGAEEVLVQADAILEINDDVEEAFVEEDEDVFSAEVEDDFDEEVDMDISDSEVVNDFADSDTEYECDDEADEVFEEELEEDETHYADIPISKKFSVNANDIDFEGFDNDDTFYASQKDVEDDAVVVDNFETEDTQGDTGSFDNNSESDDSDSFSSFFDSIDTIDTIDSDTDEEKTTKNKFKFFRTKK